LAAKGFEALVELGRFLLQETVARLTINGFMESLVLSVVTVRVLGINGLVALGVGVP